MTDIFAQYINLSWVYGVFSAAYAITILSVVGVIVSENRNPVRSLAWVTVLLALPAVGLVFYIVFGRNIKNKRIISRRNRRRLLKNHPVKKPNYNSLPHSNETVQLIKLANALSGATYHEENDALIFTDGAEKMNSLLADIASARSHINIQYYIIADDSVGRALSEALCERARAGVKVRVIYDHVGSFSVAGKFFKTMREAGVEVYPFFRVTFPLFGSRLNWRNHRKICIIDGRLGYIGGMNVAGRYIDGGKRFPMWRDLHMRVTGSAVASLQYSFAIDWVYMGQPLFETIDPTETSAPTATPPDRPGHLAMQLVTAGPTGQWSNIALMFLKAISQARKCIYIQTPYFLPTDALLSALQAAALAGVDVRIMMPRRSDSDMLRLASNSYIKECLQAGIKIYLYEKGMLHSKGMIVDDEFSTIGSTNFDFRSVEHNFESNMMVYSREFNQQMKQIFLDDMKSCRRVTAKGWRQRSPLQKSLESIMRLFAPIL